MAVTYNITNSRLGEITMRIADRSRDSRQQYLDHIATQAEKWPKRHNLSCSNFAHGVAGCSVADKQILVGDDKPNLGIVTAYNDMLSAHAPYENYPELIKQITNECGATAQVAGGTPAMCDGVTQGQPGMDLSLFSRDVIALATSIALCHNMFDAVVMLGICDKIIPGLLIGALSFGHLPVIFIPSGPMPSGLSNKRKQEIRALYADGKVGKDELLKAEMRSYHSPGTCTFYGTANSNQLLMQVMGLHIPGADFINPDTKLRQAMTGQAVKRALGISALSNDYTPIGEIIDERSIVNAIVALHATGGSTNHTIHLVAIARSAGININWDDFADIAEIVPLLARIYSNGLADINQFHAAGGTCLIIKKLLAAGLLHPDVATVWGEGMADYTMSPELGADGLSWHPIADKSGDSSIIAKIDKPFAPTGGLKVVSGELGRAIIKTSALQVEQMIVKAPAKIFSSQQDLIDAFKRDELNHDMVAVVPFQGPKAIGMPELHKLTPTLSVIEQRGFKVALLTDGRMSGASGTIPAAIHMTPEAADNGNIARIRDGDIITIDAVNGRIDIITEDDFTTRPVIKGDYKDHHKGLGRELFAGMRSTVSKAEEGAVTFWPHQ